MLQPTPEYGDEEEYYYDEEAADDANAEGAQNHANQPQLSPMTQQFGQ